jgi:hypothetical protein
LDGRKFEPVQVDISTASVESRGMKPKSDKRFDSRFDSRFDTNFDPNYAVQMLLDAAHELSLEALLEKFVARAVARPDIAFARIWMLDRTDGRLRLAIAGGSAPPQLSDPADPHLVGSSGNTSRRLSWSRSLSKTRSWE